MSHNSNVSNGAIVVAVLVVVVLGIVLLARNGRNEQNMDNTTGTSENSETDTTSSPDPVTDDNKNTSPPVVAVGGVSLEDRAKLRKVPGSSATQEEQAAHYDLAVRLAKEGDMLDLSGCMATPFVLKVREGSKFKVKNSDVNERSFGFTSRSPVNIGSGETITVAAKVDSGPGLYPYGGGGGCNEAGFVGFLLVTE